MGSCKNMQRKIKLYTKDYGVFFTSDTHYNHGNIIKALSTWEDLETAREGFASIEEMNNLIVKNTNEVVGENDVLFHLGDVAFGKDAIIDFRNRIKCKNLYVILGNHDKEIDRRDNLKQMFSGVYRMCDVYVDDKLIVLCHYAMRTWKKSHRDSISLYGHSHGKLKNTSKSMDVGIDTNNFYPYSYDRIMELLPTFPNHNLVCNF